MSKVLFLLKKNSDYGNATTSKSGLLNSATFLAKALADEFHIETAIEVCVDANEIDKFIHKHRPDYCIIEALWVTPAKLNELADIWSRVDFVVRVHSKIPFLSNEGIAIEWVRGYLDIDNVYVAFNNKHTFQDFNDLDIPCIYMPNIYPIAKPKLNIGGWVKSLFLSEVKYTDCLHVACFGAIRPLKNQLLQAMAAIRFCELNNLTLKFYINANRIEQGGESVLKNIRALFKDLDHELIEVKWLNHDEFKKIISVMDIGLQVSLSESFNVVTADFVDSGIPIVVSPDIDWLSKESVADCNSLTGIVERIKHVLDYRHRIVHENRESLYRHNQQSLMHYWFLKQE